MYEAFYGLSSKPFQLEPRPVLLRQQAAPGAKAYLEYGVSRNEGFIVITGEIGAGRDDGAALADRKPERQQRHRRPSGDHPAGAEDTLRMVGAAFGFRVKDVPKSELLITLEAFLISQTSQGKRCLLIVDEAQNLTPRAVEELRMLSNFQFGNQALLQTFLVGQPEVPRDPPAPGDGAVPAARGGHLPHRPARRGRDQGYIEHRLKCAGSSGKPTFEPGAFEAIFKASGGIPRRINAVCDRLLLGFLAALAPDGGRRRRGRHASCQEDRRRAPASRSGDGPLKGDGPVGARRRRCSTSTSRSLKLDSERPKRCRASSTSHGTDQRRPDAARLERSLLRLERINVQTLAMLQARRPSKVVERDQPFRTPDEPEPGK